jgi:hypothetical protein
MRKKINKGAGHAFGMRSGKVTHSFEVVEWIRDLKEWHGVSASQLYQLFPCIKRDTINDWIYYRTRARG